MMSCLRVTALGLALMCLTEVASGADDPAPAAETYEINDATKAALEKAKVPDDVIKSLKNTKALTKDQFLWTIARELKEDQYVNNWDKILKAAKTTPAPAPKPIIDPAKVCVITTNLTGNPGAILKGVTIVDDKGTPYLSGTVPDGLKAPWPTKGGATILIPKSIVTQIAQYPDVPTALASLPAPPAK